MPKIKESPLYLPQHWPTWFGLGLLWLIARLPFRWQLAFGAGLGALVWRLLPSRRRIVLRNLELCFPEKSADERKALGREHLRAVGMGAIEMCMSWWVSDARLRPLVNVHGMENYESAKQAGKGVLLYSAHFTTLEIAARFFSLHHPTSAMFRPPDNSVLRWAMQRYRGERASRIVPRNDVRGLLRALKANEAVWYAADQSTAFKYAEIVPFFGEPALTNVALSRIAKMSGAAVLPFFAARRADNSGYELYIGEAMADFPGLDPVEDAKRTNALIEEAVLRAPEQYFWIHRRFKNRGAEYPNPY